MSFEKMEDTSRMSWMQRHTPTFRAILKVLFPKRKPPTRRQIWFGRVFNLAILGAILWFALWRWQLDRDVDRLFASYREAGLPTNGKELDEFYPAVPELQNTALGIVRAGTLLKKYSDERASEIWRFKFPQRNEPLGVEESSLLRDYVEMNSNALAVVCESLALPKSRYPVSLVDGLDADLQHLSTIKDFAWLLQYQCLLALKEGCNDEAVASIEHLAGLAATLDDEPTLISYLVRDSVLNMAFQASERTLNVSQLGEGALSQLAESFVAMSNSNVFQRALAGDVVSIADVLSLRRPDPLLRETVEDAGEQSPRIGRFGLRIMSFSGFFARDLRFLLRGMQTNLALAKRPPEEWLAMTNTFAVMEEQAESRHHIMAGMMLPGLRRVVMKGVESYVRRNLLETAIAIEIFRLKHRRLPSGLEELTPEFMNAVLRDPFNGQPLRYRKLEQGYMLYSVGQDGQDDGGRERPRHWRSSDTNSYDITFIVER